MTNKTVECCNHNWTKEQLTNLLTLLMDTADYYNSEVFQHIYPTLKKQNHQQKLLANCLKQLQFTYQAIEQQESISIDIDMI